MASLGENTATKRKTSRVLLKMDKPSLKELHRTAFILVFITLSFMQRKDLTRIHQ